MAFCPWMVILKFPSVVVEVELLLSFSATVAPERALPLSSTTLPLTIKAYGFAERWLFPGSFANNVNWEEISKSNKQLLKRKDVSDPGRSGMIFFISLVFKKVSNSFKAFVSLVENLLSSRCVGYYLFMYLTI